MEELKKMLISGYADDPEAEDLLEQIQLYGLAATIIQKMFKGFLTRKYIKAILEYQ